MRWRKQNLAESRLAATLPTNQQWRQRIASQLLVTLAPLRHHTHQPVSQVLLPMRLVGRHSFCKCRYTVLSVPFRQSVQPGVYRVVLLNTRRVDKAVHVLVPRLQSQRASLDGHIVAHLNGQRLKRLILRVFHTIFGHASHQVFAHVVIRGEKHLRPHRLQRLLRHALQRLHLVRLLVFLQQGNLVGRREDALHQFRVVVKQRMLQRHTLSVSQRNALFQRLAGYLLQQLHLTVLIGQVKVAAQHLTQDEHCD